MTNWLFLSSFIAVVTLGFGSSPQQAGAKGFYDAEALHRAAAENLKDVMTTLLQNGADINSRAADGSTVLHAAAARGDLDAVNFFLQRGINTELSNNDGVTALHLAAINDHQHVMSALLAGGADVNARAMDGSTTLHLAVANGMRGSVEYILQADNVLMSPKNNDLFTPYVLAEKLGHTKIASFLKEKIGNISIDTLIDAVLEKTLDDVRSLVFRGADVNGQESADGRCPLHFASNITKVQFLVEHGADTNIYSTNRRETPLFDAAWSGELDIVKYLVENGAEINPVSIFGQTPTMVAKNNNMTTTYEYLKSVGGISF